MKKLSLFISIMLIAMLNQHIVKAQCLFVDIPLPPPPQGAGNQIMTPYESKNGYYMPASGEVRILFVFYEVNYTGGTDPTLPTNPSSQWQPHQLPTWANQIADAFNPGNEIASGLLTRYFQLASSGNYIVLGDYLLAPNNGGIFSVNSSTGYVGPTQAIAAVNAALGTNIVTGNGFTSITDFDKWTIGTSTTGPGQPKITPSTESPNKYDHVMFICRNSIGNNGTGYAAWALPSNMLGFQANTHSNLGAYDKLPFNIIRHEFSHMIYGGNNFHCGGGGWGLENYWIPLESGWSNMSLYNGSLNSWNAWDRLRLDWKVTGSSYGISARNANNTAFVNGDLDATVASQAGTYTLRDFVLFGDALRIKLPFIDPATEFPMFLWIENHQGRNVNEVDFDKWLHEADTTCVQPVIPGLYAYMQVDKEVRSGTSDSVVYYGYADYLRPITADGFWDRENESIQVFNPCVQWGNTNAFIRISPNPLTGGGDQDYNSQDLNNDNLLNHNDINVNHTEKVGDSYNNNLYNHGNSRHAFTLSGNKKIGMGTNPSSASMMNLVSYNYPPPIAPNVRKIYLNGISIEILNQYQNGNIQVQIRFDDVNITNDVRWCADEIVLNPITTKSGYSINLKSGNTITLDQGLTATRMSNPITFEGKQVFTSPTYFRAKHDAVINIESNSEFIVKNGSTLKLETGSKIIVNNNSELVIKEGSHLIVDECASLWILGVGKLIVENGASLCLSPEASFFFSNGFQNIEIATGVIITPGTVHPADIIFPYLTISTNVTINSAQYAMPEVLTIGKGGVLTLNNTALRFATKQSKIQIKDGGELIIDNSILSSTCQTPWQGIEVWGEKNKSQIPLPGQPNAQGKVILKNGAVIENAENAITLWKKNDYSSTGGIVQADDAVFINNRRSVEFMSYQNTHPISETPLGNISYFKNCRFEVNDEYLAPAPFFAHISMWEVDGINIQACDFINNMTNEPNTGVGILTSNANFDILPSCSSLVTPCPENNIVPNTFKGFKYGIESFGTGSNIKTIYIKNAEFNGNSFGIKLSAVNNATIIHSKFNVGTNLQGEEECSFLYGVGIELLNCKSWAIEENEFEGGYGVPGTDYIGIRVFGDDNFNTGNNIIYRNQFTQLGRANLADGKNMDNNSPYYGLSYFCNTNSNNNYDFYVEQSPFGIAVYQGLPSKPAGNTFSKHSSPPGSDFTNLAGWPVVYWYYNNEAIQQPENIIGVYPAGTSAQNSCLSNYGSETGYIEKRMLTETEKSYYEQLFEDSETSLKSVKALYASFVDGGSTEELQTEIELSGPQNMWGLRAELLSKSPHLSKEVLISASNKTDVLPDQVIFEVLAANPDELRKEELIEYLETKADPLPQYMIEILRGLAANVTYKTVLQSLITSYETSKADAINTLLRDMINDNTATLSAVRSLMGAIQSLPMDYQIVESYMQEGNITDALAMANILPQLYNISGEALEEHNRYMAFKQMQVNLINDGRNIFQLSETEKELLENLAEESNGISGMYAKNILSFVYNATFCNCPSPPADNLKRKPVANPTLIHKVYEPEISAKPNPAKIWVNFSYKLSSENPQAILEINDAQGRLIHSMQLNETEGRYVWDIRNITSGVYYYTLKSEKSAKSGKLIILH